MFGKKTVIIAGTRKNDNSNGKGDQGLVGSCILWCRATEVVVDISVDIATDTRPINNNNNI